MGWQKKKKTTTNLHTYLSNTCTHAYITHIFLFAKKANKKNLARNWKFVLLFKIKKAPQRQPRKNITNSQKDKSKCPNTTYKDKIQNFLRITNKKNNTHHPSVYLFFFFYLEYIFISVCKIQWGKKLREITSSINKGCAKFTQDFNLLPIVQNNIFHQKPRVWLLTVYGK